MRQAVLRVDHDTLAEFDFAVFQEAGIRDIEILSCDGPRGVSRIHVAEPLDEHRLDALDSIQWWEQVSDDEDEHVYLVEMDVADELAAAGVDADGLARTERAEVHSEGLSFDQTGSQAALSELFSDLKAAGFAPDLEELRDYRVRDSALDALTDRQREVVETAFDLGYYDVPRSASMAAVAAELGVDDSTVAEHLQRAERNLFASLLG